MLEFFKKNHLLNSLLLFPYAVVIRAVVLLFPQARVQGDIYGYLAQDVITAIQSWGAGGILLTTFLVFLQAAMINRMLIRQSMTGEINLFPGLCYILLTALHPSFISMSSILLANTTFLIALGYLYDILKKEGPEENRFMIGWWLAVSGLFYTPYLLLLVFGLLAMTMLKTIKPKEIFQYLTGYLSPFFITWLLEIILKNQFRPGFIDVLDTFGLPDFTGLQGPADIITISIMGLLLLISLLGYTQVLARKNIHAQKKIDTLYALTFFSIFMALFPPSVSVQFVMVLIVPMSLFMAILLRMVRHPAAAESLHFILVVAALVSQVLFLI